MPLRRPRLLMPVIACALLWPLLALAQAAPVLPAGVVHEASVEGINAYRLDNGLQVLVFPDESKPTITVNITYLVGSRHENYGETGMAHLLEHLLFKGTPDIDDIPGEMRRRGIGFNATTWLDRTNYFGSFAAGEDNLDWLLALEADRMVNSLVSRAHLDSEMTVVRNEMEAGENSPIRVLMQRIGSTAFLWHNYGNSTIGARSDVENMPIERLQAFYRSHYRPDNAVLLVAGRVEEADVLDKVVARFGAIPRPVDALVPTYTREPVQDGERSVTVRRSGETPYLGVSYHVPAGAHPDSAAIEVLAEVLARTPNGRLHRALVDPGEASFVASFAPALAEPGFLMFFAELPADADVATTRERLLELLEHSPSTPFTDEEVGDAVQARLTAIENTLNDANRLAMSLSEAIALGDWRLFFLQRDRIEAVTAADVERVASAYLKRSNRTVGTFIPTREPDRAPIPAAPDVVTLLADYSGREALAAGEAFDPSPANIDARTRLDALANGTRLALLPKRTRGETVHLRMRLLFGDEHSATGHAETGEFTAAMLDRGSIHHSRGEISRRLDALNTRVSFRGSAQGVGVSVSTRREHLPEVLDLIAEMLRTPAFPESEFEQLRVQSITALQGQMSDPGAVASNAMARHFSRFPEGHPLHVARFEDDIAALRALRREDVVAFHQRFYGAGHGEIAVVGDFDPDAFVAQADALFGSWTTAEPFTRIENPHVAVEPVELQLQTPDKANATWYAGLRMPVSDTHPDHPALLVGIHVFGGGSLKSRLADRIRQSDGLSYGVGATYSASPLDDNASISAYALAAPENVAQVRAAFDEELARLLEEGISEQELRDAVDGLLQSQVTSRAEDANLAGLLRGNLYLGRSMAWSAELEARIAALDVEEVNAALRRHLDSATFSMFSAGDFTAAGE